MIPTMTDRESAQRVAADYRAMLAGNFRHLGDRALEEAKDAPLGSATRYGYLMRHAAFQEAAKMVEDLF